MVDADGMIHQLYQTTRAIAKDLNRRFEAEGLYSSEWSIIATLKRRGPMSQVSLASYLSIEAPAISRTLLRLEEKGLIKRATGPSRREKLVSLSATALDRYPGWESIIAAHHHALLRGLAASELEQAYATLGTLRGNALRSADE